MSSNLDMLQFVRDLFPINRSLTGTGVRETLDYIQKIIPIERKTISSGSQVFDWKVPDEWNVTDAYVADESGNRIIDFKQNNLHLMGYSTPIEQTMSFEELDQHLYSLEDQPDAIPYVTSYYAPRWGFCVSHNQRKEIDKKQKYHVVVKSELNPQGQLDYAELLIPGKSEQEIFFSTYVCHPSMVNNELSGPAVVTALSKWLLERKKLPYSVRIVFIPETIGSIVYLSQNLETLKKNTIAGFNISCVADDRTYSYIASRYEDNLADKVMQAVLDEHFPAYQKYSFLERGSDERQYCAPGIDLPVVGFCRSKFGTFPEYHTSLDNLELMSEAGLNGSLEVLKKCVQVIEANHRYKINCLGEPQLGKRGLYPNTSVKTDYSQTERLMNLIAYCDGTNDLIDIAEIINAPVWELLPLVEKLKQAQLLDQI